MEINIVEDSVNFATYHKQLTKLDNSSNGTVNKMDLESIENDLPNTFTSDGWSFNMLPSGISSSSNGILSRKIRDAKNNIMKSMNDKYVNMLEDYGNLLNMLSVISDTLTHKYTLGLLMNRLDGLYMANSDNLLEGSLPLIANKEDGSVYNLAHLSIPDGSRLRESNNPEMNSLICYINTMLECSDLNSYADEYSGLIIKRFLGKDVITFTDILGVHTDPSEFIVFITDLYGKVVSFMTDVCKIVKNSYITDTDLVEILDIDNKHSELSAYLRDKSTRDIFGFVKMIMTAKV